MYYNYIEVNKLAKVKIIKNDEKEAKKKKKKWKFKINFGKLFVWVALIAMIGAAILAIISPLIYGNNYE